MLGYPAQDVPEGKRHRHELRMRSDVLGDRAQKFLISEDLGTTEFVNRLTCSTFVCDEAGDRLCRKSGKSDRSSAEADAPTQGEVPRTRS